ncbi:hypothetical protein GTO36_06315 [bacterium]|nr:hypothetical protein [bacterium]
MDGRNYKIAQGQREKAQQIYKKFSEKIKKNKELESIEYQYGLLASLL